MWYTVLCQKQYERSFVDLERFLDIQHCNRARLRMANDHSLVVWWLKTKRVSHQ